MVLSIRYFVGWALLAYLIFHIDCQKCQFPQKGLFLSFNALSKRDTLTNMFQETNTKIGKFNDSSYTQNQTRYEIINMYPQVYYSQHHQKQSFVDQQRVKVTLGEIQFTFKMNYNIVHTSTNNTKKGQAMGRVLMDQDKYFTKKIISKDGLLQWEPEDIAELTATSQITIESSEAPLTDPQMSAYTLILNDFAGAKTLKASVLKDLNSHYKQILKKHLNSQDLASDIQINYQYNNSDKVNISIDYINIYRYFFISNTKDKGLSVVYTLEIDNHTEECSNKNISFTHEEYNNGGLQQIIAIEQFKNTLVYALEKGLADLTVDKRWDTSQFQFYMGDLSNSFNAAYQYAPTDEFSAQCKWDKITNNTVMNIYSSHELYIAFGIVCTIQHKNTDLFKLTVDLSFIVRLVPEQDSLIVKIIGANKAFPKFESIDPKFSINNTDLAGFQISAILRGLINSSTFGTGWKLYKRRFPSVNIFDGIVVFFDPSQI